MKKVADTFHIIRRNGIWYYQRRVPAELNHIFGAVIKMSLRTENKAEAKKRRSAYDLEWDGRFEKALEATKEGFGSEEGAKDFSTDELVAYLRQTVASRDAKSAKDFAEDGGMSSDDLNELKIDAQYELQILGNPDDSRRSQAARAFVLKLLKAAGSKAFEVSSEAEEYGRRALIELSRRRLDRYNDKFDRTWHDELFSPKAMPVSFGRLAEEFASATGEEQEVNGIGKNRRDKVSAFSRTIVEIVGETFPVSELDDAKVHEVRSVLARLPKNRIKFYGELPLAAVLDLASKDGRSPIGATTQSDYLRVFKAMTKFAMRRKYLFFDPAADVTAMKKAVAAERQRMPFSLEQLKGFFTSDFYKSCAPSSKQPYLGKNKDWRFWMPLLMLFSGARPNEIAQLRVSDVRTTALGTHYLNLMPDDEGTTIKLKTSSSRRRIPVHGELVKMGFLQFVKTRRKSLGGSASLLGPFAAGKDGNLAVYPLRQLRKYLRAEIQVGKDQSLYSLRHNVRDALRRAQAPPDALGAIAGWSEGGKSTSDNYGDPSNPDNYIGWVNAISYPGLDLSFLHV